MDIICENCQSKFKIPDESIPRGKTATLPCPKCKKTISIKAPETTNVDTDLEADNVTEDFGFEEDDYDNSEKPFDFIEEEGKIALVCESDTVIHQSLVSALELLEYHVTEAVDNREALRNLRYKVYDLVVVDEYFGTKDTERNGVLISL